MERGEVRELHFITSIENLDSIVKRGILSHNRAARIDHRSVASESVQDRRRYNRVPGASSLHSYANLYFHARNPMMSRLLFDGYEDLIVIKVSHTVLDIPDTVVTDGNAAADGTRFYPSPEGLRNLDSKMIYRKRWTDENSWPVKEWKRARNAEVLVPNVVPSRYIEGCYVDNHEKRVRCLECENLPAAVIRKELYFQ